MQIEIYIVEISYIHYKQQYVQSVLLEAFDCLCFQQAFLTWQMFFC